jgi:hypothetical protein
MDNYKHSSFTLLTEDNYLLYPKGWGTKAVRLLTHKEMYQSHFKMTELAIPDPA